MGVTQEEYNVAKQNDRELHYKLYILNHKFQRVDEIGGVLLSDSWVIDSTSDIRRTGTITLTPDDDTSYRVQEGSKIWLDKYIQVYVGIKDIHTDEIVYTNMGVYLIDNPNQVYSATDDTITLQLVDLMAKFTGLRNGSLDGYEYQMFQGDNIRDIIIAILEENGFYDYVINIDDDDYKELPIDITVDIGSTYYDMLSKINEININYQMYFDVNGVFHYEKIPSGYNEQVMIDDDMWKEVYISHSINTDYDSLKNYIIVIGSTHDIDNYGADATASENTYSMTIPSVTEMYTDLKIGFTTPDTAIDEPYVKIGSFDSYPVKDEYGVNFVPLNGDTYYVLRFKDTYWYCLGEVTPRYEIKETNPDSPFYVYGTLGEVKIVLSGGDYENITTEDLAKSRAEWELYTRCRLLDNITITNVPLLWADVNWVINITFPNETEERKYIIKTINTTGGVNGTQSITAMRYYPYYAY